MSDYYRKEIDRLQKMVDWLSRQCAQAHGDFQTRNGIDPDDKTDLRFWIEAARRAVADGEVKA